MKLYEAAGAHKAQISEKDTLDFIDKVSHALKFSSEPIVRGMNGVADFYLLHGAAGERKSANTNNIYTLILSEVLGKQGYPLRSASIICANYKNRFYAEDYGNLYAIIPFNGVKIGVCPHKDIFGTQISLNPAEPPARIEALNNFFKKLFAFYELPVLAADATYSQFISRLKTITAFDSFEEDCREEPGFDIFGALTPQNLESVIASAYADAGFTLTTSASPGMFNDDAQHEVWIGGKCLAIKHSIYAQWLKTIESTK